MNRKGFTLIELLAVIILIAIIAVLIVPSILNSVEKSKEASYNILIENIITASESYYQECEYGDLSDESKYGEYSCTIKTDKENDYINTKLGTLANTGILKVNNLNERDEKIVVNPKTDKDISDCDIVITKVIKTTTDDNGVENKKVIYKVESSSTATKCPTEYQGE